MTDTSCWLTTDRLALRRFTAADLDWLAELYKDHEVTRYLGGVKSRPQVASFLNGRILQYYDEHPGFGIWMTIERATGTGVGFHLLNRIRGEAIIQVGFVLARSAWRTGFATEMAGAVVRYGFVDLNLPRIAGIASLRNHASQRVLEKIGLGGKKTLLVVGAQNDSVWKSVRNLRDVTTTLAHQLNPYDLLDCEQLLLTQDGLARVKEVFAQ